MTITTVFDPPLPSDSPPTFNTKAFRTLGDLNDWSTEVNALASTLNANKDAAVASANTASTAASTATAKASEALSSASSASTSAGTAAAQAAIATTKAAEAAASAANANNPTFTGNLNFAGTAQRITGDFSNATIAYRVMFQNSVTNGNTSVGAIPNGIGQVANFTAFNNSDPANASYMQLVATATESQLRADRVGTGSFLPMTFYTGGLERMRLDTGGAVDFESSRGFGYGSGSDGSAIVTTNGQGVTINKPSMSLQVDLGTVAAGGLYTFNVSNTCLIGYNNNSIAASISGPDGASNVYLATAYADGNFIRVNIRNITNSAHTPTGFMRLVLTLIRGGIST